jgi:hypothetical protein|tara:strand:+ start:3573 stop:3812 length:240 start_codon:yes stop_codon:yes gene_type:complete
METRDYLVEQIHEFLKTAASPKSKNRVSATRLGLLVASSPNFVPRLMAGHDVTTTTYDRAIRFMSIWYRENGYTVRKEA